MKQENEEIFLPYLKTGIALMGFICLTILIYVLHQAGNLLIPFVVAVFIYILLQPVIQLLGSWRVPRGLVTVVAMGVTIVIVLSISQIIYGSVTAFTGGLPRYEERFNDIWQGIGTMLGLTPAGGSGGWNIRDYPPLAEFLNGATIGDLMKILLASINSLLSNLVLVFIFLLLLLLGRDLFPKKLQRAFTPSLAGTLTEMTQGIRANTQRYIVMKTLISLLTASLVMLIAWSFGLDFIIVWGILTFFLNFIPNLGSIVSTALPALFALVQFEEPTTAVWVAVAILAVQFSVGNLLEPRVMGKSIGLSPLLIMFSLIFWGSVWGIVGMFLSVPLTAIIKIVFDNIKPLRPIGILMGNAAPDDAAAA
jgi:AI-2 transport protein TqsA